MGCRTAMTCREDELLAAARNAMKNAYAPYSRFAVGAAVRLTDGSIVVGSNFENVSYGLRSEEHTSELQSLMRISYAVFCLKKTTKTNTTHTHYRMSDSKKKNYSST